MADAVGTSEKSVYFNETTQRCIPVSSLLYLLRQFGLWGVKFCSKHAAVTQAWIQFYWRL
jgi:hypothetical protein